MSHARSGNFGNITNSNFTMVKIIVEIIVYIYIFSLRLLKIKPNAQAEIEFLIQSLSNVLLEEEDLLKNGS